MSAITVRAAEQRLAGERAPAGLIVALALAGAGMAAPVVGLLAAEPDRVAPAAPAAPEVKVAPAPPAPVAAPSPTTVAPAAPPAAAAPAAPTPADCPPLFSILFESNSGTPSLEPARVQALAGWLASHPGTLLIVDGHASSRGSPALNLELSHRRARKVAAAFEQAGVPRERITRRAFGAYAPVVGQPERASLNRRVTLEIQGGPGCPALADDDGPTPAAPEVHP